MSSFIYFLKCFQDYREQLTHREQVLKTQEQLGSWLVMTIKGKLVSKKTSSTISNSSQKRTSNLLKPKTQTWQESILTMSTKSFIINIWTQAMQISPTKSLECRMIKMHQILEFSTQTPLVDMRKVTIVTLTSEIEWRSQLRSSECTNSNNRRNQLSKTPYKLGALAPATWDRTIFKGNEKTYL